MSDSQAQITVRRRECALSGVGQTIRLSPSSIKGLSGCNDIGVDRANFDLIFSTFSVLDDEAVMRKQLHEAREQLFGGRNLEFANPEESLLFFSTEPTIIFGADVTHPAALDDTSSLLPPKTGPRWLTIMALSVHKVTVKSSSMGWKTLSSTIIITISEIQMAPHTRLREFLNLQNIFRELLLAFVERSKQRPKQLIFYRDGVSEGQFKQVLEQEIHEIEKAWTALYNEKPKITFVVVQKRHHTRLFPSKPKDRQYADKSGNIRAGTVVDNNICHPTEFDFFLCGHAGAKAVTNLYEALDNCDGILSR
ncbi:Protein argonaute 1 [Zea mays]|uniref:Protein argonaute 1 n=1 Tax=Zea mays TaxID=4577 RepID=A0A1D6H6U0_MAIZE|nr:Protein argonaute 1 [Zea mays]